MKAATLVFLCGARDYHAMDWFRSAQTVLPDHEVVLLTDLIEGEGFKRLISAQDKIFYLVVIDRVLFPHSSTIANMWRNLVKLAVLPAQVLLVRNFARRHPSAVFHAHSMYYLWLAWLAGVKFVGTPQGSDVLIKPKRSRLYKTLSVKAMKAAHAVTVDSEAMAAEVIRLADVHPHIVQNGVDIRAIRNAISAAAGNRPDRSKLVSMRGVAPLYRLDELILGRNRSPVFSREPITFIAPFTEEDYLQNIRSIMIPQDAFWGRVDRSEMYRLFLQAIAVFSIPISDSSPRSVYEAIFCGAIAVITYQSYYDQLPECMKERIVIVDLQCPDWFDTALAAAERAAKAPYTPSARALAVFDQENCFRIISGLINA